MIPYGRHSIDQQDIDSVVTILKSDWLTTGPVVEKFEETLARKVCAKHAIACSNGTTALHLAILAVGIKAGDVVLVPSITFLASANAARYVGADVVFVDVDAETGLMTAETLEEAISNNKQKNLKAIVNVHLAGQCEDLEAIHKIAKKHNLFIIEDAAHAIGTCYLKDGKYYPIGSNAFSDITTFSFHPVKTIAMGEGGAVTTNDPEVAKKLKSLRSHGMIRDSNDWQTHPSDVGPWYYEMQELGYNYRTSDVNCALGLSQLEKLDAFKMERAKIVEFYDEQFSDHPFIKPMKKLTHSDTAWHLYIVHINFKNLKSRAETMTVLRERGIGTQVHYIPVHMQPYYKNLYGDQMLAGAEGYYSTCLSLPLYVGLSREDQQRVVNELIKNAQ